MVNWSHTLFSFSLDIEGNFSIILLKTFLQDRSSKTDVVAKICSVSKANYIHASFIYMYISQFMYMYVCMCIVMSGQMLYSTCMYTHTHTHTYIISLIIYDNLTIRAFIWHCLGRWIHWQSDRLYNFSNVNREWKLWKHQSALHCCWRSSCFIPPWYGSSAIRCIVAGNILLI